MNSLMIRELEFRLIESGIHRVIQCVELLNDDQLRYRPNDNSNSINNQIIHLDGNVRQWLISTFSDQKDERNRKSEFDASNLKTKSELIELLRILETDIRATFPAILSCDLSVTKDVQCYTESLFSILVHVIEHFSYHLGQITYITKMVLDVDMMYYGNDDLDKVNE